MLIMVGLCSKTRMRVAGDGDGVVAGERCRRRLRAGDAVAGGSGWAGAARGPVTAPVDAQHAECGEAANYVSSGTKCKGDVRLDGCCSEADFNTRFHNPSAKPS